MLFGCHQLRCDSCVENSKRHFQSFIWLQGRRVFNLAPLETANAVSMPDLYIYIYTYIYVCVCMYLYIYI